ncbi:MAG: LptF/LptG family permease [Bacteroidales bacterium]|nr:LptF/LptG family permease [Bacteroidales bacterium]MDZ4205477.1 LptF/LptG family permease [Bacteroidales bacterium]
MKTIDWYIIRKFLGTFFFSILLLSIIIIIFDISEKIDDFIEKDAPLNKIIFSYYFSFLPFFINQFSALFTFISVVFFTSRMAANTEIIAILSSGVSFWRLMRPYLISAVILALLSFVLASYVIPVTNRTMFDFEKIYIKNPRHSTVLNMHMQISPGVYVYIERYNNIQDIGYKFSMEKIDSTGLYYKLTADAIKWDSVSARWKIETYQIREIDSLGERIYTGQTIDTTLNITPSDFYFDIELVKVYTLPQINKKIAIEELKGSGSVVEFRVEKYKRIAFPFANIILTLIGFSVSSRKLRGGTGLHLGIGLAITFSFVLFMQISIVFGTYGDLPPLLATWLPNIIFGALAFLIIKFAPK